MRIYLSDFGRATPEQQREMVAALTRTPTPEEVERQLSELRAEIAKYEEEYNTPSDEMRRLVHTGEMYADDGVHEWLMALHRLERVEDFLRTRK